MLGKMRGACCVLGSWVKAACNAVRGLARRAWEQRTSATNVVAGSKRDVARRVWSRAWTAAQIVWLGLILLAQLGLRFRKPLLMGLAVGVAAGVVCFLAGPIV